MRLYLALYLQLMVYFGDVQGERKKDKERQKRRKENDLPSAILAQNQ